MKRVLTLLYGVTCYAIFFATFLYMIGFLGGFAVPKVINSGAPTSPGVALAINLALLVVFGIQHSVMARPTFKNWAKPLLPAHVERSTYTLLSSIALIATFWLWQPMTGVVWSASSPWAAGTLYALFAFGWVTILVSTFLLNHFDLFGLRQSILYGLGKEYTPLKFRTPGPYRLVRHPLYVGWITAFWAIPTMTTGHLLFAVIMTTYILIAIQLEERNLVEYLPEYGEYRKHVPMLIPFTGSARRTLSSTDEDAAALAANAASKMKTVVTRLESAPTKSTISGSK